MPIPRSKPRPGSVLTRQDWNAITDFIKRCVMVTGGWGIRVTNHPNGIGIGLDRAVLGKETGGEMSMAKIVRNGPTSDYEYQGCGWGKYWCREVELTGRGYQWRYKTGGFWEVVTNWAEYSMPIAYRGGLLLNAVDATETDSATNSGYDEETLSISPDATTGEYSTPVIPTWVVPVVLPTGEVESQRICWAPALQYILENVLHVQHTDTNDCPCVSSWRTELRLRVPTNDVAQGPGSDCP